MDGGALQPPHQQPTWGIHPNPVAQAWEAAQEGVYADQPLVPRAPATHSHMRPPGQEAEASDIAEEMQENGLGEAISYAGPQALPRFGAAASSVGGLHQQQQWQHARAAAPPASHAPPGAPWFPAAAAGWGPGAAHDQHDGHAGRGLNRGVPEFPAAATGWGAERMDDPYNGRDPTRGIQGRPSSPRGWGPGGGNPRGPQQGPGGALDGRWSGGGGGLGAEGSGGEGYGEEAVQGGNPGKGGGGGAWEGQGRGPQDKGWGQQEWGEPELPRQRAQAQPGYQQEVYQEHGYQQDGRGWGRDGGRSEARVGHQTWEEPGFSDEGGYHNTGGPRGAVFGDEGGYQPWQQKEGDGYKMGPAGGGAVEAPWGVSGGQPGPGYRIPGEGMGRYSRQLADQDFGEFEAPRVSGRSQWNGGQTGRDIEGARQPPGQLTRLAEEERRAAAAQRWDHPAKSAVVCCH